MSNTIQDAPTNTGNAASCCGPDCCSPVSATDAATTDPRDATPSATTDIKEVVKEKYGAALRVTTGEGASCCGPDCCSSVPGAVDPITVNLYDQKQTEGLPVEAVLASLGCGNPTALARLNPGEVVLDLGSGGGIDVLLSAKRVGPTGKAYGLDMTDEMLNLARENQRKAGVENVEFLKGEIESRPRDTPRTSYSPCRARAGNRASGECGFARGKSWSRATFRCPSPSPLPRTTSSRRRTRGRSWGWPFADSGAA